VLCSLESISTMISGVEHGVGDFATLSALG
jgi:hypothetical protein